MIIRLNENIFDRIFLFESGNSKRAHRMTRQVIADYLGKTADDPEVIAKEQQFEKDMFGEGLRQDWFITIEPFAAKWVFVQGQNITDVKNILSYLATKASTVQDRTAFMAQVKSFDYFGDLWFFVEKCKKEDRKIARENNVEKSVEKPKLNPNYEVLGPLSFEEAHKYYPKTGGNGASCPICYTQYEGTWSSPSYSNRGTNSFFLLLRKDWEKWDNTRAVHDGSEANNGLGEPYNRLNGYDDYGLSMVLVWVTPEGELHESNTRWNHGGDFISPNVDKAFTVDAIQKLMGGKFEDIFNVQSAYETLDTVEEKLASDESLTDIFSSCKMVRQSKNGYSLYEVRLGGYYNLVENLFDEDDKLHRNLIFKDYWAESIFPLNDATDLFCEFDGKGYVYTIENNLVPFFNERYINVLQERIKNGANLESLFTYVSDTFDGFTPVGFNQIVGNTQFMSYNIVTSDGSFLSDRWESTAGCGDGPLNTLRIILGNRQNLLKEDGTFLFEVPFKEWPTYITFNEANGGIFTIIREDGMHTILRSDLSPITGEWYKDVENTNNKEGFCIVQFSDGYYGYVNLRDGSTLGRNMKPVEIQWHFDEGKDLRLIGADEFGGQVRGAGHVAVEREGEDFMLTKDNELFDIDDFIEYHKSASLLKLANGEKIEDVFNNSTVIGGNIFVETVHGWNMLNKERNKFVFPSNFLQVFPLTNANEMAVICFRDNGYYRYNFVRPDGSILFKQSIDKLPRYLLSRKDLGLAIISSDFNGRTYDNIVTENGLMFDTPVREWPNWVDEHVILNKYVKIRKSNKVNFINLQEEELIWKQPLKYWFTDCIDMGGVFQKVSIGKKENVLSFRTKSLIWEKPLNKWFDRVYPSISTCSDKFTFLVYMKEKKNIIDDAGRLIWNKPIEEWFDGIGSGWNNNNHTIRVWKGRKCEKTNLLRINGRLVFKTWFDGIESTNQNDGVYTVRQNGKVNLIDIAKKKLLFKWPMDKWPRMFEKLNDMNAYRFWVGKKGNVMTTSGRIIWDKPFEDWFDGVGYAHHGFIPVWKGKKENLLLKDGNLVFDEWYNNINFQEKITKDFIKVGVTKNGKTKYNMINKRGELIWKKPFKYWFDSLGSWRTTDEKIFVGVAIGKKKYCLTKNGELSKKERMFSKE